MPSKGINTKYGITGFLASQGLINGGTQTRWGQTSEAEKT